MEKSAYERYCELRDKLNYKDADVAKGANITKSTFSDWKAGRYVPKQEKLQKIADYFGVSVEYLMTGKLASKEKAPELTARDEKDITKDLESIMKKLSNNEDGPASFEGTDIPEADQELFAGQLELMLRRLKAINKDLYNPTKNKK